MIRICVAGATGRMGRTVISEAMNRNFEIVGAVASPKNPGLGKTLRELKVCDLDVPLYGPSRIREALEKADVYLSFTTPEAELVNVPEVADMGRRIVMGTTGFTEEQLNGLKTFVSSRVPAVFASNFSIGVNFMFKMLRQLVHLPDEYEISIVEAHHSKKRDAPSGTALSMAKIIAATRGYGKMVHGREKISLRARDELEVLSVRAGGIPGIHEVIVAGLYDMISISHVAFSRNTFALGALRAAEWVMKQRQPGVYSMEDVLSS
ncbi:MAG: 4-hydroxy-tetrahydrodipicolinate reductase [Nitrososphaerota archaeon]|nr:4-hydroxy-tetrahydrodipicolinate reductase [Candidatus Bathyarchaeota archaeon]MDW8023842.1 4-hydroxy-tetrahydrodipicolinate reductase [Nitrososphaerota archaeon]